jgi:ubiquitin carboxyl-terminal hydrolase 34
MPCGPFLRAAVIYCEHSLSEQALELIIHIAKVARQIDNSEGRAYLHFFKEIMALPSTAPDTQITTEQITETCLETVGAWGPGLLCHYDSAVRKETELYLLEIIFVPASEESIEDAESQQRERLPETDKGSSSFDAAQRLGIAVLEYLNEAYVRPRQTVVRATLSSINVIMESATPYFDADRADAVSHKFFEMKECTSPFLTSKNTY